MQVRAGVIGLGMGRHHAKVYHESKQSELVAICDANSALLDEYRAVYPQARAYTNYQDLLASGDCDVVSVALPNYLHAPVAVAALQAGMHVLCEKPMAVSAQAAETMLKASQETGKHLMIHFNYRYSPPSQFLKRYVDEGHLGEIYYAKTRWLRSRGIPGLGGWFGVKELSGGGPLIDLGVHRLDLAMWLMSYPKAVSVSASSYDLLGARLAAESSARYDVEDLVTALIRLENGVTLNLEVSWAGGTDKREDMLTGVYGTEGAVIQRNTDGGYQFEALALQNVAGALVEITPSVFRGTCPSAVEHFVQCIAKGCAPDATAEQGLEMMRIIDAIYRSAQEGCEVKVERGSAL